MRAVLVLLCCVASEVCTSKWPSPAWVFLPCCFCSLVPLLPPPLLLQELNHRGMPTRGYVLIFVFWALLTIITPTLVSWSASAKPNLVAPGETLLEMKVNRRMMGSIETAGQPKNGTRKTITRATVPSPAAAPAPAPVAGYDALSKR